MYNTSVKREDVELSVVPKVQALVKMPLQYFQLTLTYLCYIYLLLVHIFSVFKVQIKIQLLSKYGISGEFLCLNCKFSRKSEKDIICASHSYAFSEDIFYCT